MSESIVLDVVLIALLLAYFAFGLRVGLSHAAFAFAGIAAGAVAAWVFVPVVASWVPWPEPRPIVTILSALALIAIGNTLGSLVGRSIRRGVEQTPLSGIDRAAGGIATLVAAALIASVLGASVGALGVPALSRAVAGSTVLRAVSILTPDPVETFLAQLRSTVIEGGLPVINDAFGLPEPVIPTIDAGSPELTAAAQSVVRITGNAVACGKAQAGSGFVVADDRVVTNAHVLAGVTEPVIEAPDGQALAGTVVYFDPIVDLAVIAVPGLNAGALDLGPTAQPGTEGAVQGYPFGGPFSSIPAGVMATQVSSVSDIYEADRAPREVYTLAAAVREGNSGGPVLSLDGDVIGVVFARSADDDRVGYAMTMSELDPVAALAPSLTSAVDTGACIR